MDTGKTTGYRPDIDGLRAIAVLSVIFYHVRSAWIPGGYVGVDIFFVISGYLITRNIWGELQSGHFSLANFYLRRIRRIAPVFLVMTAVTIIAGTLLLLPGDLLRLAKSAVFASLSAANIYYWKYLDTSYFAAASEEEPLLHTWSLGVEEQFYLIWPAMLMLFALAKRARPVTIAAIIAICVGSFVVAQMTNISAQKFSYYMLPARAGELMMGALLALRGSDRMIEAITPRVRVWIGEATAILGLALIAFSLWRLNDASRFPGLNALYPCLGSVLVIFAGQLDSRSTRFLLASRPMVYIGLISYSLYLWHWPILAFIRYFYGEISMPHAGVALVAMLALSVASYRLVEQPARRQRMRPLRQVMALLVVPVAVILLASGMVIRSDGLKSMIESSAQFRAAADRIDRQTSASNRDAFPCLDDKSPLSVALRDPRCVLGDAANSRNPSMLLWGDSNAAHYVGALRALGERDRFAFRYVALSTCPALYGDGDFGAVYARDRCNEFREGVRKFVASAHIKTVILAAQWTVHDKNPQFKGALNRTINELEKQGVKVVMLGQVPWFPGYTRECELRWARVGHGRCEQRSASADKGPLPLSEYMSGLAKASSAAFVDVHDVLCRDGQCSPYVDGVPVYFNPTHLSAAGSYRIGEKIVESASHAAWSEALAPTAPRRAHTMLFDAYRPGFQYKIRSQRHDDIGNGQYQHVVIAEYVHTDAGKVAGDLSKGLTALGFSMQGPLQDRGALRYLARRNSMTLTVIIHANPAVKLINPGAIGIISFAWKDRQAK